MRKKIDPTRLKVLQVIHSSLMLGVVFFAGFVLYITDEFEFTFNMKEPFNWVALFLAVAGFFMGNTIFNRAMSGVDRNADADELLNRFQSAHIIRMGFLEAPAIFSVVVCMLTNCQSLLLVTAFLLAIMYAYFPTEEKISGCR